MSKNGFKVCVCGAAYEDHYRIYSFCTPSCPIREGGEIVPGRYDHCRKFVEAQAEPEQDILESLHQNSQKGNDTMPCSDSYGYGEALEKETLHIRIESLEARNTELIQGYCELSKFTKKYPTIRDEIQKFVPKVYRIMEDHEAVDKKRQIEHYKEMFPSMSKDDILKAIEQGLFKEV